MATHLSDNQLAKLQNQLQDRFGTLKQEIRQELLESNDECYLQLAGRVHDRGDEAVADLLTDIDLAVIDRHIREIQDIEATLLRIAKSSYGLCLDCDGAVAYKRLRAYPTAKRCHDCQVAHEKTYRQRGHPAP
jgi:DnaK suppressor protein